jgi:hypothetical protein
MCSAVRLVRSKCYIERLARYSSQMKSYETQTPETGVLVHSVLQFLAGSPDYILVRGAFTTVEIR